MKYIYIILSYIILSSTSIAQEKTIKVGHNLFTLTKTDLNTENTEFGGLLTDDNIIYFVRTNSNLNAEDKNKTDLDIYQAVLNLDHTITDINAITTLNSKWHDGPITLTSDGNTMYYASESFNVEKGFEKERTSVNILKNGRIYIFKATNNGDEWEKSAPLPFNNVSYSLRNPSISKDGKTLYFSSDMPGGQGGEDLWKVSVNGNSYGDPENLGETINTSSDESFPFISSKNILYFSSNMESGMGGFDVYKMNLNEDSKTIVNLGLPVNSDKDDYSFTLNDAKKIGFVSSNRDDSDNIYFVIPNYKLIVDITMTDKETGAQINSAKLSLLQEEKIIDSQFTTLEEINYSLECDTEYSLVATKEGYENATYTIEKTSEGGELVINIQMQPIAPIITETEVKIPPVFFDFDKSNITKQGSYELDKLIAIMKEKPELIILVKSHTDSNGSKTYNLELSNKRAQATVTYIQSKGISEFRIFGKGFGESNLKVECQKCSDEDDRQNRRSEFIILKK